MVEDENEKSTNMYDKVPHEFTMNYIKIHHDCFYETISNNRNE